MDHDLLDLAIRARGGELELAAALHHDLPAIDWWRRTRVPDVKRTWRRTYSLGRSDSDCRRSSWRANASNADSICRVHDGTQMAPCSITPMRSSGNRSSTPSKIIVARVWAGGPGMPM